MPAPSSRSRRETRLAEIILNLAVRIEEAQARGQFGEAEGRKADLTAAKDKLAQMDYIAASRRAAVDLGMPAFAQAAPQTVTASPNP